MKEQPGRKAGMPMDNTVFGYFKHFASENEEERVKNACSLIEFLCDGTKEAGEEKAAAPKICKTAYALKRLVRGVGSMQNDSRIGFFTALVGLLERLRGNEADCPTVTELFALVKSELTESGEDKEDEEDENYKGRLELRIGKIFICGAIIKSGLIDDASQLELQTVLKTLKQCMHQLLTPLVYTFLNDLASRLDAARFSNVLWPVFEPVLNVPKENHSIDSTFFLLQLSIGPHRKLLNRKYFERNFGAPKLLHEDNFPFLSQLLFGARSAKESNHPFYECLLQELNNQKQIVPFWRDAVVPVLGLSKEASKSMKLRDFVVLRMAVSIFNRLEDYTLLPEVLQPEFVKFFGHALVNQTKHSSDKRELYQKVCTGLLQAYPKLPDESVRVGTFRRLMQAPGGVLIEKHANCKLLHNLLLTMSADSLRTIADELKAIILNESTGTNGERSYAACMLQRMLSLRQLAAQTGGDKGQTDAWHQEVVKFFLTLGVFYSADGVSVLKGSKGERTISGELARTMRGLFFASLEHHHAKLSIERTFLLSIVRHVDKVLRSHGSKCLRTALTEDQMACWNKMFATVASEPASGSTPKGKQRSSTAGQPECDTVFHILLMHMGLHLFSDPEVACSSIVELECVMKRIDEKAKQRRKSGGNGEIKAVNGVKSKRSTELELEPPEPEWIEVVVDLFLNLLSQNSHLLRKVIAHLFPHLSGEITLTALHQILSVINLKDKTNPLTAPGEDENEAEEGDEKGSSSEEEDSDGDSGSENDGEQQDANDDDDEDEDEEEDDEDIMGDEEEEENISDTMRQAIQQALGGANTETDTESLDLDELDDEQGRQLDEALTAAFRAFRKKKAARKRKGPTKAEKQIDTVLTHFRMRVLDLIDAYLKHEPDMLLCLELMLYIFEMLPVALREESKYGTILKRYKQIFATLIRIKKFKRDAEDVRMDQLEQMLRDLIEKVAKGVAFPERNQYLLKACQFIIICSQALGREEATAKATGGSNAVDKMFGELLVEFITNRNPSLSFSVFQSLLRMQWSGVWHLTEKLVQGGLKVGSVRAIRRIQTLQLLQEQLQNRRQLYVDKARSSGVLRSLCTEGLTPYVAQLEAAVVGGDRTIGQNELYELLLVLIEIHRLPAQLVASGSEGKKAAKNQGQSLLKWETIGKQVQSMRRFVVNSQTMTTYRQFCQRLNLTPISNEGLPSLKETGAKAGEPTDEEKQHTTNGGEVVLSKKEKRKKQKTMNGEEGGEHNEDDAIPPRQQLANGHVANGDSGEEETQHEPDVPAEVKAKHKRKKEKSASLANGLNGMNGSAQEEEEEVMEITEETSQNAREKRKRKKEKLALANGHDTTNGSVQEEDVLDDADEVSQDAREKRKRKKDGEATEGSKPSKKEKRRRKEALMQAASEGLEECSFAKVITIQ